MLDSIRNSFVDTPEVQYIERFIILKDYYAERGMKLHSSDNAYKVSIRAIYDIASRLPGSAETGEKHTYVSVYGHEFDKSEHSDFTIVSSENISNISNIILNKITDRLTELELTIEGETDIELTDDIIKKSCAFNNIVKIDMGKYGHNKIHFPKTDINIKSFYLSGGNLIIPSDFRFDSDEDFHLSSVNLISEIEDVTPDIKLTAKHLTIDGMFSTFPVKMYLATPYQEKQEDFRTSSITLNRITFNLENYSDRNPNEANGMFKDPIITIGSNVYTTLTEIAMFGGDYRKFMKVDSSINFSATDVYRKSKSIFGYTFWLDSVRNSNFNTVCVNSRMVQKTNCYVITTNPEKTKLTDNITIHNADVRGVSLINCDGYKGNEVVIINCNVDECNEVVSTLNSEIMKLSIKKSILKLNNKLYLEGNNIDFSDSTIKFTDSGTVGIVGRDSIKLYSTNIFADTENCEFGLNDNCSLTIKNSEIQCRDLTIHQTEETDETVGALFVSDTSRQVKFERCIFSLYGDMFIGDGIYSARIDSTKFVNVSNVELKGLSKCTGDGLILECQYKSVPVKFDTIKFSNFVLQVYNATQESSLICNHCEGEMGVIFKDIFNEEVQNTTLNVSSSDSKLGMNIGSDTIDVKAKINSNGSAGSCFFGISEQVTVVPDLVSKDISIFEFTPLMKKKYDKVMYGKQE